MNIVTASRYCAECGKEEGGVSSLKACTSCKLVKYCDATCQRNHWKKHKKQCKQRAAELRDEALFKDPPPKEDCPICFHLDSYRVLYFHPRLYHPYQSKISRMPTRGWQIRIRTNIIHVAERAFVVGACTPFKSLETI